MKQLTTEALSLLDRVSKASRDNILTNETILKDALATIPELTRDTRTQNVAAELLGNKLAAVGEKMISPDQIVSLIDQDEEVLLYDVARAILHFKKLADEWKVLYFKGEVFKN